MKKHHSHFDFAQCDTLRMTILLAIALYTLTCFPPFGGTKGGCQNIGINTTGATPDNSAMLDVVSTTKGLLIPRVALASSTTTVTIASPATSLLVYNSGTGGLTPAGYYYNSGTPAAPLYVQLLNGGNPGTAWMLTGNTGITNPAAPATYGTSAIGATENWMGTTDARDIVFGTNNIERMRIMQTTGRVGIGTASPLCKLHVLSTDPADANRNAYFVFAPVLTANQATTLVGTKNEIIAGSAFNFFYLYNTVNHLTLTAAQTGTVTSVTGSSNSIQNSGTGTINQAWGSGGGVSNLSTGTINNAYGLSASVSNTGGGTITNGYGLYINPVQATNKWSIYALDAAAPSYFAGSVGIGTTAPGQKLHVDGNSGSPAIGSSNTGLAWFAENSGGNGINIGYFYNGVNPTYGWIQSQFLGGVPANYALALNPLGGNVGIGTTTPGGQLELSLDQGRKPSTNTWTIVSDARLKNIEGAYTKGLKEVLQLQPILYQYKNAGERKFPDEALKTMNVGFSAQDVQKIFPEAVGTDADSYLNFNMHSILVAYVNAIKELNTTNQNQQKLIEAMQKENKSWQMAVGSLQTENQTLNTRYSLLSTKVEKLEELMGTKAEK